MVLVVEYSFEFISPHLDWSITTDPTHQLLLLFFIQPLIPINVIFSFVFIIIDQLLHLLLELHLMWFDSQRIAAYCSTKS
jgi:hypothetical protein